MKRVLILASVASMISQFNMDNIKLLKSLSYEVHVACNFVDGNTCNEESIKKLKNILYDLDVLYYHIGFSRNILNFPQNIKAYKQVKKLLLLNQYYFIHCHSPIGGLIGRMGSLSLKNKIIYTAHGFHFYKGAPIKNWILYFPVEWICSWVTDVLITINQEDYNLAQKHLHAKKVEYIPGIGIDIDKFECRILSHKVRDLKRMELGMEGGDIMLLSVGELNINKNHKVIIKALSQLRASNYHYFICGIGSLERELKELAERLHISSKITFLSYRFDMLELYQAADIFLFPSMREGLSVALMEAMASGLPVVCGRIRGNTDLIDEGLGGYLVSKIKKYKNYVKHIENLMQNKEKRNEMKKYNETKIKKFDKNKVLKKMNKIYRKMI